MGKLIDPGRRERAAQQRAERKKRILEEAHASFEKLPYVEVNLDSIGQRADVDRGVASMYFRSKEELFLLILKDELDGWYENLESVLKRVDGPSSAEEVARILADRIARRPLVTRLLSLTPVVLEQNLDAIEVFRFLRWRRIRMEKVGAEIDRVLGNSNPGGGIRALHLAQLIAAGFDPIAHPRGAAVFDHGDPEFEVFVIDMERQMRSLLTTLLTEGPHRRDP